MYNCQFGLFCWTLIHEATTPSALPSQQTWPKGGKEGTLPSTLTLT